MPIGEAFHMWDVTSRKVYIKLVVSKLEGHCTTQNCMPKDIKIQRGELYLATDAHTPLLRVRVCSSREA